MNETFAKLIQLSVYKGLVYAALRNASLKLTEERKITLSAGDAS